MLLAIDIGNTHTVLGLFDGEKLVELWRIATDARRTADELALTFRGLLADQPTIDRHRRLLDGAGGAARAARDARRATTPTCRPSSSSRACGPA